MNEETRKKVDELINSFAGLNVKLVEQTDIRLIKPEMLRELRENVLALHAIRGGGVAK